MEKTPEEAKKILEFKNLFRILYGVGIVLGVMLVFSAGILVGFHKASYGSAWGENYSVNFGMGRDPLQIDDLRKIQMTNYFPNAHGAVGKIIEVQLPNIIVQDRDNTEKVIMVNSDTKIQRGRSNIETGDFNTDDFVVVIGTPNGKGVIEAKLIRVIPSPEFLK